jgi:hypothetical protein
MIYLNNRAKLLLVLLTIWIFYQFCIYAEGSFFFSKYGDDGRFTRAAVDGQSTYFDLFPNVILTKLFYYATSSVEASLLLLRVIELSFIWLYLKIIIAKINPNKILLFLFVLSSSDLFFVSTYSMRDSFLILLILLFYFSSGLQKFGILGFMIVIRPVSLVFLSLGKTKVIFICAGAFLLFAFAFDIFDDLIKIVITPTAYLSGQNYDISNVIEYRQNLSSSNNGVLLNDDNSFSLFLKPIAYFTRPLIFNDITREVISHNGFTGREYLSNGFNTDLLFQNIAVGSNLIYMPLLILSLAKATIKKNKIAFLYLSFSALFAFSSGQARHQLMFNFLELLLISQFLEHYKVEWVLFSTVFFILTIVIINFLIVI